jgi:hypothetical protein
MRICICTLLLLCCGVNSFGQNRDRHVVGTVSYINSKHIYVKFGETAGLEIHDTIYSTSSTKPCLVVINKSSISSVCEPISDCIVKKGDQVYYLKRIPKKAPVLPSKRTNNKTEEADSNKRRTLKEDKSGRPVEQIRARVSVASYSTLSDNRTDIHRLMSRISFNATNINHSKLSVYFYSAYRQNFQATQKEQVSLSRNFNVYDFALKYEVDSSLALTFGRKINYRLSSVGAIDGFQAEKKLKKMYIGAIAGFRPDINDYSLNSNLFEYGAYLGTESFTKKIRHQITLGLMDQKNAGKIDRRYSFLQGSATFNNKLRLYSSLEMDMYSKLFDSQTNSMVVSKTDYRLTNLYLSARYRFNRKLNLMLSYDNRKRLIYYETFQTEIEQLLDNDIARQGFRMRLNSRLHKHVYTGVSLSRRFQSDQQNKSENMYGYVRLTKVPTIGGRLSASFNYNTTKYSKSDIASFRYSRSFLKNSLNTDFYYRLANYKYLTNNITASRQYYGANLAYYLMKNLMLSITVEYSEDQADNDFRINTRLIKRFKRKRI